MIAETIPGIEKLTPQQKLALAAELWGEFDEAPQDDPQTEAILKLLDARMEEYRQNPETAMPWADFRKKWGLPVDE